MILTTMSNPKPKANRNSYHKAKAQEARSPFIVVVDRFAPLDIVYAPEIETHTVQ